MNLRYFCVTGIEQTGRAGKWSGIEYAFCIKWGWIFVCVYNMGIAMDF